MNSLIRHLFALMLLCFLLVPALPVHAYYDISGESLDLGGTAPHKSAQSIPDEPKVQEPPTDKLIYMVHKGDTLSQIARGFRTTVAELQTRNGIANPKALRAGQQIVIPSAAEVLPLLDGKTPVIEQVLLSTLTAYTAGPESTGKKPGHPQYGITYSGAKAKEGRTAAVDPDVIPLGSTIYIEGIGIRKAEDTGSAIKGPKIDVFIDDLDQAQQFGVKRGVKVFVLSAA